MQEEKVAHQHQRAAARRLDRGRVGADRAVRLSLRGVPGLPDRAAPRRRVRGGHGAVRRPAGDPQPRLRAADRDPGVRPVLRQRVRALGPRRELPRVGIRRPDAVQRRRRLAPDRPAPPQRHVPAPARRTAHRRQHGQHPAHSRGSRSSTSCRGRSSSGWSASTPASGRTTCGTTPAPRRRSSSSIPRRATSSAPRRSSASRSGATCCSRISRIRGRCCSRATGARCGIRWIPRTRSGRGSGGRTTASSSR